MCVLMEEAAESVASTDVEAVESFRFGDWFGERPQGSCTVTASKARVNLLSRSLIRYRTVAPASWRSMTKFLATWMAQSAMGWTVAPRMRMRRLCGCR